MDSNAMKTIRPERYGSLSQALHWITAFVVFYAFSNSVGGSEQRVYAVFRDYPRQLHETVGLLVLVLVVIRLAWRLMETRPAPLEVPRWMEIARKAVEVGLYVLLFAV